MGGRLRADQGALPEYEQAITAGSGLCAEKPQDGGL